MFNAPTAAIAQKLLNARAIGTLGSNAAVLQMFQDHVAAEGDAGLEFFRLMDFINELSACEHITEIAVLADKFELKLDLDRVASVAERKPRIRSGAKKRK